MAHLLIAVLQSTAAFQLPVPGHDAPARRARSIVAAENPLANLFGKKKDKPKGGPLTQGLDAAMEGAPLAVKALGTMLKPLAKLVEGAIADGIADADQLLADAGSALRADSTVRELLGDDVQLGAVFSSASSSSSVNGVARKTMQYQAQCSGSRGSGTVAIRGEGDEKGVRIDSIQVQASGRVVDVSSLRGGVGRAGGGDGVIDVDVT